MKTIEEKAKAYDETIEALRSLFAEQAIKHCDRVNIKDITNIFSELKESKGEKTKRILHSISSKISFHLRDIFTEEEFQCFDAWSHAWLKKQCEQKPWSEEDEIIVKTLAKAANDCVLYGYVDKDKLLDWLKSLKERVLSQPKQEWKQENTGNLTDFENAMMHIGGSFFGENAGLDPNDTNVVKEQANFLLGLAQSKEWNEEDKNRFNNLIFLVECSKEGEATKQGFIKFINKLKSLKPQSRWKPSDEQMKALEHAINCYSCISPTNTEEVYTLEIMKEQLKKLREE